MVGESRLGGRLVDQSSTLWSLILGQNPGSVSQHFKLFFSCFSEVFIFNVAPGRLYLNQVTQILSSQIKRVGCGHHFVVPVTHAWPPKVTRSARSAEWLPGEAVDCYTKQGISQPPGAWLITVL